MVHVEVVYAPKGAPVVHAYLSLATGSSVQDALQHARLFSHHPEAIDFSVGIFGKVVSLDTLIKNGQRIEVYRPLEIDPKEKRRRLALVRHKRIARL